MTIIAQEQQQVLDIVRDIAELKPTGDKRRDLWQTYTVPYMANFDEVNGDSKVELNAGTSGIGQVTNDNSGIVRFDHLKGIATSDEYTVLMKYSHSQRTLMNNAIHAKALIGTGQNPYALPLPLILGSNHFVSFTLLDLSIATNTIRFNLEGYKFYGDVFEDYSKNVIRVHPNFWKNFNPYFYTTDEAINLPNSSTTVTTAYITVVNNSFLLKRITLHSEGAFKVKMTRVRSSMAMTNGYIHSSTFGGTNTAHLSFRKPFVFEEGEKIKLEMINLVGSTNKVYWCFGGINVNKWEFQ